MHKCSCKHTFTHKQDLLWVDDTLETYLDDRKTRKARGALQTGCK